MKMEMFVLHVTYINGTTYACVYHSVSIVSDVVLEVISEYDYDDKEVTCVINDVTQQLRDGEDMVEFSLCGVDFEVHSVAESNIKNLLLGYNRRDLLNYVKNNGG